MRSPLASNSKTGILMLTADSSIEGNFAAIRVGDDGEGLAPEVLPRILALFTRENRANAPEGLGVGRRRQEACGDAWRLRRRHRPGRGKGSALTAQLPPRQPIFEAADPDPAGGAIPEA